MPIAFEISYFTKSNGAQLAYGFAGRGPLLVQPPGWAAPLMWPGDRPEIEPLLSRYRLLTYDMEGSGLSSGRMRFEAGYGRHADELLELLDHLGIERAAILGESLGVPTALDLAARHPDRVACIVSIGGYAKGPGLFKPEMRKVFPALVRANWGMASTSLADMFTPTSTAEQREELALGQRLAFDPEAAAQLLEEIYNVDIESQLVDVVTPTLVIHSRKDRAIPFEGGKTLAARIPGARLMAFDQSFHLPRSDEDCREVVAAIHSFVQAHPGSGVGATQRSAAPVVDALTDREREVLRLIGTGLSNDEISKRLSISTRTVERHVSNIYGKLGVGNRVQAAGYAIRNGLAD